MSEYNNTKKPQTEIHYSSDKFMDELDKRLDSKFNLDKNIDIEADYEFLSGEQILEREFPKESYFIKSLIPKDGITCIGGLPTTMKSYFSNYLALCILEGKPVLERYPTEKTNILFIDKENKLQRIKDRLLRLGMSLDSSKHIFFLNSNFIINNDMDLATVCAFIKDHKIGLTFIDTLVRVHNYEENSASEMNKVFIGLKELMLSGSAICFLHHFNKRGSFGASIDVKDQLRGSGDILAMVDSYIALSRKENFIEVEQAKSRDEMLVPKFLMQVDFANQNTYFDYIREVEKDERIEEIMIGDRILALLSQGTMSRKFLIESLKEYSEAKIDRALRLLKTENRVTTYSNSHKEKLYTLQKQEIIS